ncbi:MAG: EpsG family protein [Ruminococcaceae bacterium]|nr:EpsG family protein [Oscillospiraceae bacterium]
MIYVAILLFMVLLRFCLPRDTEKSRRVFVSLVCVVLVAVAACRAPEVGRDTSDFMDVFDKLAGRGLLDALRFSSWVEPLFRLLCLGISLFTKNAAWLVVVSSVIIHVSVCRFIYHHTANPYLACFLYLTLTLYPWYLNVMRQALAIAVLLWGWGLLKRRRFVCYSLVGLLAAGFHVSALLFLLCPFACLVPVSKKSLSVLLPLTAVLALLGAIFVRPVVALAVKLVPHYADYQPTRFLALYGFLAFFVAVCALGIRRFYFAGEGVPVKNEHGFDERGFLTVMMLCGVVVGAAMTQFGQLQRVFNYFEVCYLLWLPLAVPPATFDEDRRHLSFHVIEIATVLVCLAYFFFIIFARSATWYDALPYRFFWQ